MLGIRNEYKRSDSFLIALVRDIKMNGSGYVKSFSTVEKIRSYSPDIEFVYDKHDKIYIAHFNK